MFHYFIFAIDLPSLLLFFFLFFCLQLRTRLNELSGKNSSTKFTDTGIMKKKKINDWNEQKIIWTKLGHKKSSDKQVPNKIVGNVTEEISKSFSACFLLFLIKFIFIVNVLRVWFGAKLWIQKFTIIWS